MINYAYWLSNIPGIGIRTRNRLIGAAGSAREVYGLTEKHQGWKKSMLQGLWRVKKEIMIQSTKAWRKEEFSFCPEKNSYFRNVLPRFRMHRTVCM